MKICILFLLLLWESHSKILKHEKRRRKMKLSNVFTKKNMDSILGELSNGVSTAYQQGRELNPFAKKEEDQNNFNFAPGFAGMPFPPFLLNGPHYHAPMNVNVNVPPKANIRGDSPYQVAIQNEQNRRELKSDHL